MSSQDDRDRLISASRRNFTRGMAALPLIGMSGWSFGAPKYPTAQVNTTKLAVTDTEVTVGQLHSATGTMAISETGSIQAEQLAIDQINAMGGILGRKIKVIKEDGASAVFLFDFDPAYPNPRLSTFHRFLTGGCPSLGAR